MVVTQHNQRGGWTPTVFVVDDHPEFRRAIAAIAETAGLVVEFLASIDALLASLSPDRSGCVVLPLNAQEIDRSVSLERLRLLTPPLPLIFTTRCADVGSVVRAARAGASAFLVEPLDPPTVARTLLDVIDANVRTRLRLSTQSEFRRRLSTLTPREREVLELIVSGKSNRETAHALKLSPKTVEVHRMHVMQKAQAANVAELVRVAIEAGVSSMSPRETTQAFPVATFPKQAPVELLGAKDRAGKKTCDDTFVADPAAATSRPSS